MARVISFMYVFLILWPVLAFPSIQSHRINQGAHWSDGSDHTANRRQSLGLSMSMRRDSKHRRVNALNSINSKKFTTNSADHSNIFRFRGGFTGNYNSDSFSSGGGFGIDGGRGDGGGNDGSNLAMIGSSDGEGDNNKPVSSTPLESLLSLLKEMLNAYSRALKANPYLVKMVSSGVIGGTGDFLIQKLQNKDTGKPFDLRRFAIFTSVATFYIAPVINIWFNYLSTLSAFTPGFSALGNALVMTAVDQTVGALVINAGFFFAFELAQRMFPPYGIHQKSAWDAGVDSVKNNMWETLVVNWYIWPAINFLNFLWIPLDFRLLVSNLAAVFWNMFLSSMANRGGKS